MNENFDNEMKLEFVSKANNEAFARITIAAFVAQLNPTIEELADIKTAVSEAVTNAIIHAYDHKQGVVKMIAKLKDNMVIIEISDQGKGIENINIDLDSKLVSVETSLKKEAVFKLIKKAKYKVREK